MTHSANPLAAHPSKSLLASLWRLLVSVLLLAIPRAVQAGQITAGQPARASYTVQMGIAPAPGGEGVMTLVGPLMSGAMLQWQRKAAGEAVFVNVVESATYHGAAASTLRVSAAKAAMNGDQFRCVVIDVTGTAVSAVATLVVGPPVVGILGGNGQVAEAGQFNAQPFDLAVWDATGVEPLVDTPVTFTVQSGGGLLAAAKSGGDALATSLTLRTDADGTVQAYYRHALTPNITSQIKAWAGTREVIFESTSLATGSVNSADATNPNGSSPGSTRSVSTGTDKIARGTAGPKTPSLAGSGSTGGNEAHLTAMAHASSSGVQVVLRGRSNQYYSVDIGTWEISSTAAP
jgi:hypothetical protein